MRLLLLVLTLLLTACSNHLTSENGHKRSKSGSYAVKGHTYKVMPSAGGYKARGMASWYGKKFHQHRTSNGEHYNMYAMTAAHKTLPLSTYVKVKNLKNNREVVVRVNDRGPFHRDRIIDLSYAAASQLGLTSSGTAMVEVVALNKSTIKSIPVKKLTPVKKSTPVKSQSAARAPVHKSRYYVRSGTFKTRQIAENFRKRMRKVSSSPMTVEKYRKYYVVKAGPFANQNQSLALKKKLEVKGVRGNLAVVH